MVAFTLIRSAALLVKNPVLIVMMSRPAAPSMLVMTPVALELSWVTV